MPRPSWVTVLSACLLAVAAGSPGVVRASCVEPAAVVVFAEGSVSWRNGVDGSPTAVHANQGLCAGAFLVTGRDSRAAIRAVAVDTLIRLDQSTTLRLASPPREAGGWQLDLLEGAARFLNRAKRGLRIDTPFANASVEGTEFLVRVDPEQTWVDLFEGTLVVANPLGELRLHSGQGAHAARGQAPRLYELLHPVDAVQWGISYEPMLAALLGSAGAPPDPQLQAAYALLLAGDVPAAFARLDPVPAWQRDAAFFNVRAALYLSVGRRTPPVPT